MGQAKPACAAPRRARRACDARKARMHTRAHLLLGRVEREAADVEVAVRGRRGVARPPACVF